MGLTPRALLTKFSEMTETLAVEAAKRDGYVNTNKVSNMASE